MYLEDQTKKGLAWEDASRGAFPPSFLPLRVRARPGLAHLNRKAASDVAMNRSFVAASSGLSPSFLHSSWTKLMAPPENEKGKERE